MPDSLDDFLTSKLGYGAERHPENEVSLMWEWLPATITSRQPAFAKSYGGHEMPLPQKNNLQLHLEGVDR
jgi:hypothetical protein